MVQAGTHVAALGRDLGQRAIDVEPRHAPRQGAHRLRLRAQLAPQPREELALARDQRLACLQRLRLQRAQRRRDEALAPRQRLPPLVVRGHARQPALGHLQVVAEGAVVADLEVGDAAAAALLRLQGGDGGAGGAQPLAGRVALGVGAGAQHVALLEAPLAKGGGGPLFQAGRDRRLRDRGRAQLLREQAPQLRHACGGQGRRPAPARLAARLPGAPTLRRRARTLGGAPRAARALRAVGARSVAAWVDGARSRERPSRERPGRLA